MLLVSSLLHVQTHIADPKVQGCDCEDCQRGPHVQNVWKMRDINQSLGGVEIFTCNACGLRAVRDLHAACNVRLRNLSFVVEG